jgi:hypothetical protein
LHGAIAVPIKETAMTATATKASNKSASQPSQTTNGTPAFWASLAKHVTPIEKLSSSQAQQDPVMAMRTRFANKVAEQIRLIQSDAPKSRWFTKRVDGSFELSVRSSNIALSLADKTHFAAKDATAAIAFLETIANGAKSGELDAQLKATTRKPPQRKPRAPNAAAEQK